MIFIVLSFLAVLAVAAVHLRIRIRDARARRVLAQAIDAGIAMDDERNIDVKKTYAGMLQQQEETEQRFEGKQAHFMELMRIIAEGPERVDEIRFLFAMGLEPMVRPDGLVYVPTFENEHLSVDGEVELREVDLDQLIEDGHIKPVADVA